MSSLSQQEIVNELEQLGVATVYEAAGRSGYLHVPLTPLNGGLRVAGTARIASCGQGDNRAVHEVMAHVKPGDILILRMPHPEPVALLGELLATQAKAQGAAGILVDAAVRDVAELRRLGVPIWTRFIGVNGANKNVRGQIDIPVAVGGTVISPGDYVVLDDDGAVAISKGDIEKVINASKARVGKENNLLAQYREGALSYDLYEMRKDDEGS